MCSDVVGHISVSYFNCHANLPQGPVFGKIHLGSQLRCEVSPRKTSSQAAAIGLVYPAERDMAEKAPLLQEVYARIKDDIFEFRMPPGQRYSEHELAAALGVSRTPLRFALHLLAGEGYLSRLEGHSSWQVKPLDLDYYDDLYDFRTDIETIAVDRLCRAESLSALDELCAYWRSPKSRRTQDFKEVADEDERFHHTLVALAGSREMLRTFGELSDRIRIVRRLDFMDPQRISATFEEHGKILELLLARDADGAKAMIRSHIGTSRVEIRKITLHRLALATTQGAQPSTRQRR
jgi:DNA-binding GntR family transcriptional regulator